MQNNIYLILSHMVHAVSTDTKKEQVGFAVSKLHGSSAKIGSQNCKQSEENNFLSLR